MEEHLQHQDIIERSIKQADLHQEKKDSGVKLLFMPIRVTRENLDLICKSYSRVSTADFETVVIVESVPGESEKKLAMPSFKSIKTELGEVPANVRLRNDFADEDDDFFINDHAFDENSVVHQHLPILQTVFEEFSILHIQITDERFQIVQELATALQEILPSRKALLICCCEVPHHDSIHDLEELMDQNNRSAMMNRVNQEGFNIKGAGAFLAGFLVAKKWGLKIYFESDSSSSESDQTGIAVIQNRAIIG